jgi:hypothetical protein
VNDYRALSNDTDREKRRIRRRICPIATLSSTNNTRTFSCGVLETNLKKIQYEGVACGFKWLGIRPTAGIVMVMVMKIDITKAVIP